MKTILCYGDSNTWGYNPRGGRYDHTIRWPTVMASLLNGALSVAGGEKPAFWVVEEGLNGRTTCLEDPVEGDKNGLRQLIPILTSHKPLDLVIVMLGTNDCKHRFNPSLYEIALGAQLVVRAVMSSTTGPNDGAPGVLMVCPAPLYDAPKYRHLIAANGVALSGQLAPYYQACAKECGAAFFDAGTVISASSPVDGIHWEADDHKKFATAMADKARELLA